MILFSGLAWPLRKHAVLLIASLHAAFNTETVTDSLFNQFDICAWQLKLIKKQIPKTNNYTNNQACTHATDHDTIRRVTVPIFNYIIPALNAWAVRALYTVVRLSATQFPGHGCMDDLTTESSFDL